MDIFSINVSTWTNDDVARWLRDTGFENFIPFFNKNRVAGQTLLYMTKDDLYCLVKYFGDTFNLHDAVLFERYLERLKEIHMTNMTARLRSAQQSAERAFVSNEPIWKEEGFGDSVRVMEAAFPEFCWRFKSAEVLCKDFNPLHRSGIGGDGDSPASNAFHVETSHVISPVEFYSQPKLIQPMLRKLQDILQDVYSESTGAVPRENVYAGMPCVTRYRDDDNWYRARVLNVIGTEECLVKFVDYGNMQYVPFEDLKPLKIEFGRLPPAALLCRIQGVRERTLEQKVLNAFKAEIEELGSELLISIVAQGGDPFLVDVFNKYTGENIGKKYLPKEPLCPKLPPSSQWKKKSRYQQSEDDEDAPGTTNGAAADGQTKMLVCDMDAFLDGVADYSSSDDGQTGDIKRTNKRIRKILHQEKLTATRKHPPRSAEDEERQRVDTLDGIKFQRQYRKQRKPLAGIVNVIVSSVVSTSEIYLRLLALEDPTQPMSEALNQQYGVDRDNSPVPILPAEMITPGAAVVMYDSDERQWTRCKVLQVMSDGARVQSVDTGKRFPFVLDRDYDQFKILVSAPVLDLPPQAFACRLDRFCEHEETPTEKFLLCQLLKAGMSMKAEFERSRSEPWRVRMWYPEKDLPFYDRFEVALDEHDLRDLLEIERRPCLDVAVWKARAQ